MKTLSVEQQIAELRPLVGFAPDLQKWILGTAAVCIIAAVLFWHPWPLMIGVFLGIAGLGEKRSGPNIVQAVLAYDCGTETHGEVSIAVDSSDAVSRYYATVREQGHPEWDYEFIPVSWKPANGIFPALIWRHDIGKHPVLTAVEDGILIPRSDPKQPQ
jgi:hypothetical protein